MRPGVDSLALAALREFCAVLAFERRQGGVIRCLDDCHILVEIATAQERGELLTIKALYASNVASPATVQRRLQRLRRLGAVLQRRNDKDRRSMELFLAPAYLKALSGYRRSP